MAERKKEDFYLVVDIDDSMSKIEKELRFAVDFLSANRLSESAKWASELLSSIKVEDELRRDRTGDNIEMTDQDEDEEIDPSLFRDDMIDCSTGTFQSIYPIHKDESF